MMVIEKDNAETSKELERIIAQKDPIQMMEDKRERNKHLYQKLKMRMAHITSVNGQLVPDNIDADTLHANIFERNRKQRPKHTRIQDDEKPNSNKMFRKI